MQKIKLILIAITLLILVTGCETIKEKTDEIVEKENQKLTKFIGQSSNNLLASLGKPDEDFKNNKGNLVFIYNTKKYGIPCERKFEINATGIIVGFTSSGCI